MLRKEIDELQVLKNQVKDLAREVELLKIQAKTNNKLGVNYSEIGSKSSGKNFGRMLGNLAMHTNSGSEFKSMANNKQIFGQLVKAVSYSITNQFQSSGSFSRTKEQSQYQQAQNFRNISHKLY
jgi:hypothetical protein